MKQMRKKALKGMTIVECMIALLVFSVAALVMVKVGMVVCSYMTETSRLNRKVMIQAPKAETHNNSVQIGYGVHADPASGSKDTTRLIIEVETKKDSGIYIPCAMRVDEYQASAASDPDTNLNAELHYFDVDLTTKGSDGELLYEAPPESSAEESAD